MAIQFHAETLMHLLQYIYTDFVDVDADWAELFVAADKVSKRRREF